MRALFKAAVFLFASGIFLLIAGSIRAGSFIFRINPHKTLVHTTTLWARTMLRILNITVVMQQATNNISESSCLIVANHQSYLDIIIIASIIPTLFVARHDVRSWPILGWLASLGGTLFIDRKAFRGAVTVTDQIGRMLLQGINVQIFPEGTSTNGGQVLPFRSFLFTSVVSTGNSVLPLSINYESINSFPVTAQNRDILCWYGERTFVNHFWQLLSLRSANVSLSIHPPIAITSVDDAQSIAQAAFTSVEYGFSRID